ncbi:hypothetical protein TRVA0_001S07822 [Trichomonascus vanleenenianus]|uniref:uncharacterized protein n=1 Tax=Trichomonascus vanleenenianus TaxID=2268995 RepID=UPI003EC988E0
MKRYCIAYQLFTRNFLEKAYNSIMKGAYERFSFIGIVFSGVTSIIISTLLYPILRDFNKMLLQDVELISQLEESRYQLSGALVTLLSTFSTHSMSQLVIYLLTTIVLLLVQVALTFYLITTSKPLHNEGNAQINLISETQKYLESYCKHLDQHCQSLEEDLYGDIDSLKKRLDDKPSQASEKYSASLGMLWNEAYKIRQDIISLSMSLLPNGTSTAKNDQLRDTISSYPETYTTAPHSKTSETSRYVAPLGSDQKGHWPKFRPKSILRTEYGAFDLSTKEGREHWKMSVELARKEGSRAENIGSSENARLNMAKKDGTIRGEPSQLLAPVPEHIGFRQKHRGSQLLGSSPSVTGLNFVNEPNKLPENDTARISNSNKRCDTVSSATAAVQAKIASSENQALTPMEKSVKLSCFSNISSPVSVPVLTSADLKAKLDEGEKKQYRRLFIPGRGWMSAKRLQEERLMLEEAEKREAVSQSQN